MSFGIQNGGSAVVRTDYEVARPVVYRTIDAAEKNTMQQMIGEQKPIIVDRIEHQLKELVSLRYPETMARPTSEQLSSGIQEELGGCALEDYGVWVYYPWRNTLVHLLDEEAFIEVRTNRNQLKITAEEQEVLRHKKVGIIGLSVGSGAALAIALERGAGEIRIADMDTLDLSNLNRIRSGVHNLGLSKAHLVAREIAELDPFIRVVTFDCGIDSENIEAFFDEGGRLDALVELCDSLPMKLLSRVHAKKRGVPVIMETSDRGLLDVERFDLFPDLGILHGRFTDEEVEKFLSSNNWSTEVTSKFMRIEEMSSRMKISMGEMGKTISRWPQLGSEVTMGAGVASSIVRKVLLGEALIVGRKFIDLDEYFVDKK